MERLTGRERFLLAISNQQPDRLPCQVHSWMRYYRNTYLGGVDQFVQKTAYHISADRIVRDSVGKVILGKHTQQ